MAPTRVLIVDDSVVVRKVLSEAFTGDPSFEVAGTAATGSIALQKIPHVNPDVVVLDVEMPDMDGLETVRQIHANWPKIPVIMCSALTERGADTTMRALAAGASDYVAKPSTLNGTNNPASFHAELRSKVLALCGRPVANGRSMVPRGLSMMPRGLSMMPRAMPAMSMIPAAPALPRMMSMVPSLRAAPRPRGPVSAIAIGCSTGGPNALATLFEGIPRELPVPIFIVQHMPPVFTKHLADRLRASTGLAVHEATEGQSVVPGEVFIAPGNYHMTVVRDGGRPRIALNQEMPENSCRPAVDVLFRSVAHAYGNGVLAAVLTGMGRDGTRGARDIVEAGGTVIVQDTASSVVASMPEAVVTAGLSDGAYPLDRLAHELVRRTRVETTTFRRNSISP